VCYLTGSIGNNTNLEDWRIWVDYEMNVFVCTTKNHLYGNTFVVCGQGADFRVPETEVKVPHSVECRSTGQQGAAVPT